MASDQSINRPTTHRQAAAGPGDALRGAAGRAADRGGRRREVNHRTVVGRCTATQGTGPCAMIASFWRRQQQISAKSVFSLVWQKNETMIHLQSLSSSRSLLFWFFSVPPSPEIIQEGAVLLLCFACFVSHTCVQNVLLRCSRPNPFPPLPPVWLPRHARLDLLLAMLKREKECDNQRLSTKRRTRTDNQATTGMGKPQHQAHTKCSRRRTDAAFCHPPPSMPSRPPIRCPSTKSPPCRGGRLLACFLASLPARLPPAPLTGRRRAG